MIVDSRVSELHSAIGLAQVKKFTKLENTRKKNFLLLKELLRTSDKLVIKGGHITDDRAYYCLIAELKGKNNEERNHIIDVLKNNGLQTSIYYPHPVPRLKYYANKYGFNKESFKNAINFSDNCISFSIGAHLCDEQILKTADIINRNI